MKNPACRGTSLPKVCSLIIFVTGLVLGAGDTQRAEARLGGRNQVPDVDAAAAAARIVHSLWRGRWNR